MTKHEIIDQITRQSGLKRREISYIVDSFLGGVLNSLDGDDKVEIRGFGVFYRTVRKSRTLYSPIAKRSLDIPARSVVLFKASKSTEREIQ
ncbi:MAG: HU family DNA-binding protein [Spirochaetes bacterium]|nr:MAG: HU family DNA-binding protein [Spirochaetota bacterium]